MTLAYAKNEYQSNTELYASKLNRASDLQTTRYNAAPQRGTASFETTASEGSAPMQTQDAPYELQLRGEGSAPQLRLYKPGMAQAPEQSYKPAPSAQTPEREPLPGTPENATPLGMQSPEDAQRGAPKDGEGAKTMEEIKDETTCPVCESRTYQDGSADPGVSMKFATKLNRFSATAAIRAHEYQHVRHHQMDADKTDRKVISQTVMLRTRKCPHCGKMYTAGGTTKTVTAAYSDCAHQSMQPEGGQKLDACV